MNKTFDLDTPIEVVAERLATVYKDVTSSKLPIFRWLHVFNDATILAEEVRRNNFQKGAERAVKILMRLLEFIGYYLYVYKISNNNEKKGSLSDLVARVFRTASYKAYFGKLELQEGPTRWILAKYPFVCAKCGQRPCHCMINPWIFEERREKPYPFEEYRTKTLDLRKKLKEQNQINLFSLKTLIDFFNNIYRNTCYYQDSWKLVMHLTEELGEATIELSRLELIFLVNGKKDYLIPVDMVKDDAERKLNEAIKCIKNTDSLKQKIEKDAKKELDNLLQKLKEPGCWKFLSNSVIGEQFKEEIADVFSWLAAVIYKLSEGKKEMIYENLEKSLRWYMYPGGRPKLKCPYCNSEKCTNDCVVSHAIANELIERAFHQ